MPTQRYGPGANAGTPPSTPEPSPGCAAWALGALLLVLVVLGFVVWGCVEAVTSDPPTPSEVRDQRQAEEEQRRAEEDVKVYCGLWWDGLMELTDEQAQLCVDTGWGR